MGYCCMLYRIDFKRLHALRGSRNQVLSDRFVALAAEQPTMRMRMIEMTRSRRRRRLRSLTIRGSVGGLDSQRRADAGRCGQGVSIRCRSDVHAVRAAGGTVGVQGRRRSSRSGDVSNEVRKAISEIDRAIEAAAQRSAGLLGKVALPSVPDGQDSMRATARLEA